MTEIRTERFLLRPPVLADAERITDIVNDPRIYEMVARIPAGQHLEQTGRWILSVERGNEFGTDHAFAIIEDNTLIGMMGAHRNPGDEVFELGYWVAPDAWKRGVATEAGQAVIDWLAARGQADKIISGHFADNPASGRVLHKLGFEETGMSPVFCAGRDQQVDHIFMVRRAKAR